MSAGRLLSHKAMPEALEFYREALVLTQATGDLRGQTLALNYIGAWYYDTKAYDEAIVEFQAALNIARKIGAVGDECNALGNLTASMAVTGHPNEALKYINEAVEASRAADALWQAVAYDDLGLLLFKNFNERTQAIAALKHAYDLYSEVSSPLRDHTQGLINAIKMGASPEAFGWIGELQPPR
jgi:tetratricopeptide (TPR) repeat protein